jgi:hypothetical protein
MAPPDGIGLVISTLLGVDGVMEKPKRPKKDRRHGRRQPVRKPKSPVDACVEKWGPMLGKLDDIGRPKEMLAAMLENEAKHLEELKKAGGGKIGNFEKFAFPLIRKAYPKLIGDDIEEKPATTPLQDLTEQTFAEHHPSDPDWEEWKESVKARVGDLVVSNTKRGLDEEAEEMSPELRAELDNVHLFEPPPPPAGPLISVQPMTQPVGGLAFYRPKYGKTKGAVEPGEPEEAEEE